MCLVNHHFIKQVFFHAQPDLYAMVDGWRCLDSSRLHVYTTSVNIKSRGVVKHCLQVWGQLPTSGECPHVTDVLSRYLIQIILMIIGLGDWWGPALRARGRTSQTAKHHQCQGGRLPWSCSSVISCPGAGLARRHASCGQISGDMTDANYTDKLNTATSHHHTMHRGVHRQYGYLYHCAGLDQHSDQQQCSGMIQNHYQLHCHSNLHKCTFSSFGI